MENTPAVSGIVQGPIRKILGWPTPSGSDANGVNRVFSSWRRRGSYESGPTIIAQPSNRIRTAHGNPRGRFRGGPQAHPGHCAGNGAVEWKIARAASGKNLARCAKDFYCSPVPLLSNCLSSRWLARSCVICAGPGQRKVARSMDRGHRTWRRSRGSSRRTYIAIRWLPG